MLIDGFNFEIQKISSRENVENPEVAKFKAKTHNRIVKDYSQLHNDLFSILKNNYPDIQTIANSKPLQCAYYIPSKDLYVDDRLDRNHNYNLFRKGNGIQQRLLNELISNNEEDMIRTWCITDISKSKGMDAINKNYIEIYSFKDEQDVIIQINRMSGLKIIYDKIPLRNELKNLLNNKAVFEAGCFSNKITITYNPHFYEQEQILYKKSITRRWIIENLMKYLVRDYESDISDGEILRQFRISRVCDGFSQHSPYWIKAFIEKYNIKFIYDFSGGWGHRLLGSWNIDYIYNDIDDRSLLGTKSIYLDFKDDPLYGTKNNKFFYNEDAAIFTPPHDYDCVFSCPPYAYVELYKHPKSSTNVYTNYCDWLNIWWKSVVKSSLKPSVKYFAFIVNNTYKEDMKGICLLPEFGLEFIEEISLNKSNNLNHFHRIPTDNPGSAIKNIQKGEKILVFKTSKL